jgi:aspartyl-tRNA(Asn)/glutamyl-tRNA(Gln) amidotransferase subunit B
MTRERSVRETRERSVRETRERSVRETRERWEAVIGLEIHTQLQTRSKIFSSASAAFGAAPNEHANGVDIALPGTLPVLNAEAVRLAVKFGLAIGAEIASVCHFDRKNYFYPDLPKGYQISQLDHPIVGRGAIELEMPDGTSRRIGITRAHLEEDAGRSLHDAVPGHTGIDLNRAGTPLLEIVTEPDLRTPEEAAQLFRQLHELVVWLGICDGKLNEGSMRCDANVSVRKSGSTTFGERTEIKNINSFEFVEAAIRGEIERQIAMLERGEPVLRQTLRYDPERDATTPMRGKEQSDDYRYFPEPDLLPLAVTPAFIAEVRATMTEPPAVRRARYQRELGLSAYDARQLTQHRDESERFEYVATHSHEPKLAANLLLELRASDASAYAPDVLVAIVKRTKDGTLSSTTRKQLMEALRTATASTEADVDALIDAHGLRQMNDTGELAKLVADVVAANPKQVEQFRAGKDKVFGFFVGQVMKQTGGKANPQQLNELLRKALSR